jgi:hypothetical protein
MMLKASEDTSESVLLKPTKPFTALQPTRRHSTEGQTYLGRLKIQYSINRTLMISNTGKNKPNTEIIQVTFEEN